MLIDPAGWLGYRIKKNIAMGFVDADWIGLKPGGQSSAQIEMLGRFVSAKLDDICRYDASNSRLKQ